MFTKAYIPYKGYYSSPFCRWQGSYATEHPVRLAGATCKRWLAERHPELGCHEDRLCQHGQHRGLQARLLERLLGGGLLGAERTVGVWLSQACSTGTTAIYQAAMAVEVGSADWVLERALRPGLQRPAHRMAESQWPRRFPGSGRLGHGQLQLRPLGSAAHGHHRRPGGQRERHHQGRLRRALLGALQAVPGRYRQRFRVPEALHVPGGSADQQEEDHPGGARRGHHPHLRRRPSTPSSR